MRALPPLTLSLTNHRNWNAAVCALAALAACALAGWALGRSHPLGAAGAIGLAMTALAIAWLAWGSQLPGPLQLRWDGQGWQLGDPPRAADCRLALDLGPWMLLRCRTDESVTWLPLQRSHLRADWHTLRCTVYAPLPATGRAGTEGATR